MHETVDGTFGRRLDVDKPIVRANFEMLAAVLIDKGATQHTKAPRPGRQRDGSRHLSPGALDRVDNLRRRAV